MSNKHIEINIDKLILEGCALEDGEQIRGSVERELTRLLAGQGIAERLTESYDRAGLQTEQIAMEPGANTGKGGKQIARTIYGALKR